MSGCETPSPVGAIKEDQFQIPATPCLKRIGYGTGVNVYHWDRSNQSPWALKKIFKQNNRESNIVPERIEQEASILKKLNHPNIVGFRGFKKSDTGRPILAMEDCGTSLGDLIATRLEEEIGRFEPERILKVICSISSALCYLHSEQKIIHGDIKSFNILIKGDFDQIKLCDFGVSYPLNENGEAANYIGTLCWNAPEVLIDGPFTAKADIFAFGLTIYEMLALEPPHSSVSCSMYDNSFTSAKSSCDENTSMELDSDGIYGTRPNIPDLPQEYDLIVQIFEWCTESDYKNRPNAGDILSLLNTSCNN